MCEFMEVSHGKLTAFSLRKNIGSCQSTHLNIVSMIQNFSFINVGKTRISGRSYFTDVIPVNRQPQSVMGMNTLVLIKML